MLRLQRRRKSVCRSVLANLYRLSRAKVGFVYASSCNAPLFHANLYLAAEKCQHEKRKTVNGEDILFAMTSLGFENYGEALKIYLSRYRDVRIYL